MKVVVDAFGGDNAPKEIVKGVISAVNNIKELKVILTGKKQDIEDVLAAENYHGDSIEIVNADEVISNDEQPTVAIKQKTDSSLVVALNILKTDSEVIGLVSAGSTGAVLTGGFMKIGRMKGVSRPGLCPTLPTYKGTPVVLIDCGANIDSKPINLLHFAILGSKYYETMYGKKEPRVAILNIGAEESKGNELVKTTFPFMKELPINFVGSMEAREFLSGEYDVVVADGFVGNVLLKSTEGATLNIMNILKREFTSSFFSKLGALLLYKKAKKLKKTLNYSSYGGSPFLGLNKIIIKSHGSSKAESIYQSILQVTTLHENNCYDKMRDSFNNLDIKIAGE